MRSSWLYLAIAVGAGGGAGLDLAASRGDREVGDGRVLGLAAPVAHHAGVAGAAGEGHAFEGLGEGADLVHLDQDRVGDPFVDPLGQDLRVGDEEVVADELDLGAEGLREVPPAVPVLLAEAVLDGDDGIGLHPLLVHRDHLVGGLRSRRRTS